jgi:NTP pyrophosphatase (non-canonical NTP hydrolase)
MVVGGRVLRLDVWRLHPGAEWWPWQAMYGTAGIAASPRRLDDAPRSADEAKAAADAWLRDFAAGITGAVGPADALTLADVAERITAWQAATFGPVQVDAAARKLLDEAQEMADALADVRSLEVAGSPTTAALDDFETEVADVLFLCLDLSRSFGGPAALAARALAKLERNEAREWTQAADERWNGGKGGES